MPNRRQNDSPSGPRPICLESLALTQTSEDRERNLSVGRGKVPEMILPVSIAAEWFKSISLDIFDTLLIRTADTDVITQNASLRWADIFRTFFDKKVSIELIAQCREDCRSVGQLVLPLCSEKYTGIPVFKWFSSVVDMLVSDLGLTLDSSRRHDLVEHMIRAEVETEERFLRVNEPLKSWARSLQECSPATSIFFLSDMYLRTRDIQDILGRFELRDLFDDGATSGDEHATKRSGQLYKKFRNGQLVSSSHLHIGDDLESDVMQSRKAGCWAVHYTQGSYVGVFSPFSIDEENSLFEEEI